MAANDNFGPAMQPDKVGKFLKAIRSGNYIYVAAEQAGISRQTVNYFINRGEGKLAGKPTTPETLAFALAFREAEAECEAELVSIVYEKAKSDPYLALKYLARRFPLRWGNRGKHQIREDNWQEKALEMIRNGELDRETVESEFGAELADQLFAKVGQVTVGPDRPQPDS